MKKLISMLLAFCMVVVPLIATVSATNITNTQTTQTTQTTKTLSKQELYTPINSNFKKQAVFSESGIDLDALGVASWCQEDFIQLYELGFTELVNNFQTNYPIIYVRYSSIVSTFYNLLKMYYGEEIIKGDIPEDSWDMVIEYLVQKGILYPNETNGMKVIKIPQGSETAYIGAWMLDGDYSNCVPADSFGQKLYGESKYIIATRQDIQVLITRLLKAINVGEPINSLSQITDVDENDSENLNFDGILELYNMGIFSGDSHGSFNAYDYIKLNEFVTVISRIVFPNRRVQISNDDYSQKLESSYDAIQTYNSIDPYWYQRVKEISQLDSLYLTTCDYDDTIYLGEILYVTANALDVYNMPQTVGPFKRTSKEYYLFLQDAFSKHPCSTIISIFNLKSINIANISRVEPISKKEFAKILTTFAERQYGAYEMQSTPLKNELAKELSADDLRFLTKAVSLGLIEDTTDDFSSTPLSKAEFEKMLVQFMLKFSTFVFQNGGISSSKRINVVTDPTKLPTNYKMFPYITDTLSKGFYESLDLSKADINYTTAEEYIAHYGTPKSNYDLKDSFYYSTSIISYFDTILNVDYRTITVQDLINELPSKFENCEEIKNYVDYVKKHKIILSGKGIPDFSCCYKYNNGKTSGEAVACRIEVNVISSDIQNPKLLIDCLDGKYFSDANTPSVKYIMLPISSFDIVSLPNITD